MITLHKAQRPSDKTKILSQVVWDRDANPRESKCSKDGTHFSLSAKAVGRTSVLLSFIFNFLKTLVLRVDEDSVLTH